ncbi:helicase [Intrasporangium oryzae NRRL B-24470]|uniref:Helicase n=1 Tax=Intrasporangium oryzae NRRL B-24470 TaxID=1386089 RepID=W9GFH0_9MICO|nr:helicase-related protein [Intrasporangium oryzae]EWT02609.1 helicase [Intrasporangium oryzae NRRL B-24470]
MKLEDIASGAHVEGLGPTTAVVLAVQWHGEDALEVTYKAASGLLGQRVVYRSDEPTLKPANVGGRPFDASAADFKLAAEAQRIKLAGLFDPMLAVTTSDVQPLPHQIRAVYGELLPRTPLRFLLADDPGAGKTIMAGLYIKELRLRDDVQRCLIVAPGGLVEQWQDELFLKFGLRFDILTNQLVDASLADAVFQKHPLLITRMDQLARNDDLKRQLEDSEWDLVVVDEAHRMGAHYFAGKLEKTKRFQLGELLGRITRHLLLMTATPHSGKEEDFQLFLTLLDRDRYEGKFTKGVHAADTSGVMRRMVKEDLLTFEGKPLFPERVAETVPYELTELEQELYEQVTEYVREGMNRAQNLDGKRRNTVGFALTVLQRRLASSPEAIYRSLVRRAERLDRNKQAILSGEVTATEAFRPDSTVPDDPDEYSADEIEEMEEELVDSATAARTVAELETELQEIAALVAAAKRVRDSGQDRKWVELRTILEDNTLEPTSADGAPRKLIIFTEHRDTLDYLTTRIRSLLGKPFAVQAIHGGVRRGERRQLTEEFTKNPEVRVLLATDAAGEGLNLQVAHLMVNYDLPWNPNRIEQRFGRIHRIGQTEVCRLWNIVASNTREGEVFTRLLEKIEEQRKAYGGKVFDVLGHAFDETPLRDLLLEAIRYGDRPEVRAKMHRVIDASVAEGLKELLEERALANETLAEADLAALRRRMDEAMARRLQPHYIEGAFREAFKRIGGRLGRREQGRFEIGNVPVQLRTSRHQPVATRYERVAFDLARVEPDGLTRADLIAPGHPLHDAVIDETISRWGGSLERGAVLASAAIDTPQVLVAVTQEVVDGTGASIARRFGYAFVSESGEVSPAGPAPYLDMVQAPSGQAATALRTLPWLGAAEARATSWIIAKQLPDFLDEVRMRRAAEIRRTRELVSLRLNTEINRLFADSIVASDAEAHGQKVKESSEGLSRKATELEIRLDARLAELSVQESLSTRPPHVVAAALVLPVSHVEEDLPGDTPAHAVETKEVERRGVDLVLATERALGRRPLEQAFNNPGFDILSESPDGLPLRIEVKARLAGAEDYFVTHNEVITGKNAVPRYRLALVRVDPEGREHDQVRYLGNPFANVELGDFDAMGVRGDWAKSWSKAQEPF